MSSRFITELEVEESLHALINGAAELGQAVEALESCDLGIVEAVQMELLDGDKLSDVKRKQKARASQAYRDAVIARAKAAGVVAALKGKRDGHKARIEAWRSQEANTRDVRL